MYKQWPKLKPATLTVTLTRKNLGINSRYAHLRLAHLNLRAHLLDLRCLLFHGGDKGRNRIFQCFNFPMLLKKLVEQHQSSHYSGRSQFRLLRCDSQVRIHLGHLFSDQAVVQRLVTIDLFLVAIRNRFEPISPSLASSIALMSSL